METNYADFALLFKALSDETRLKIIGMLSGGELCACDLLGHLSITQPTLSYHMKILSESGLVNAERRGAWMHYTLRDKTVERIAGYWGKITSGDADGVRPSCCEPPEGRCGCED